MSEGTPFLEFLRSRLEAGGFATDDALAAVLPLLRQAVRAHGAGKVGPLDGLESVSVTGTAAWYKEAAEKEPLRNAAKIDPLDRPESLALDLIGEVRRTTEVDEEAGRVVNLQVGKAGEEVTKPVYLPGYRSWEHALGHHDALTDTFSLGMLLASVSCGLDFTEPAELERFASSRSNLFTLRPDLNPVVAKAIVRMTELSRHRRAQDLPAILKRLENYRDAGIERDFDTKLMKGFRESDLRGRRQIVFGRLRERLFEISRRNRLLYFRPSLQSLNLTWASVPLLIDVRNVRPDQLFTWQADVARLLSSGSPVALEKYLRFEDAPYAREVLDRIISEAKRDQAEYGFAQLRLVLCFLRWHNLKEEKHERIDSPLLLLPVRLTKKKGVRDSYLLEPTGTTAEVNPVLRHHLKQLYAVEVPEAVELTETTLDAFHQLLSSRIVASEPGVTLNKIDRPKIEMVYDRARRRLDQYRRRLRLSGRGVRSWGEIDYCYERENFQPLGLRLFQMKVRPSPAALREILQERPGPRTLAVPEKEPVAERERKVVEFHVDGGPGNPYSWDFDLCSLTVGNFKYRKMSLVRDYEALLEEELPNAPFDSVFSLVPRAPEEARPAAPPLEDQFPVVACDPTQASAVSLARTGKSFIIQGPPGTGKSQTITNLIADHVARGKHVLFVCEKRAALDVVFHRLKQAGLSELCSLIHDSQQDKKEFILDLKATYDAFLKEGEGGAEPEARRLQAVQAMKSELEPLRQFDERMRAEPPAVGVPVYRLLHRRLEMDDRVPDLAPVDLERFPEYRHWRQHAEALDRMGAALRDLQPDGVFRRHPLRSLAPRVAEEERPIETVLRRIRDARVALDALELREAISLEVLRQRIDAALLLRPLAERDLLGLLAAGSEKARTFEEEAKEQGKRRATLGAAEAETGHWKEKLPAGETGEALEQARALEGSFLAFLKPAWWRLRKVMLARYDFAAHALRPTWTRVLEKLDREHQARAAAEKGEAAFREKYRAEGDSGAFAAQVREIATRAAALAGAGQAVLTLPAASIVALASAEPALARLEKELAGFLDGWGAMTPAELREELQRIEQRIDHLPDWLPCLGDLGRLPPALRRALREEPLTLPELEGAMAERGVRDAMRSDRFLAGFGGKARDRHAHRLEQRYEGWLDANAAAVKDRVRLQFRRHVAVSSAPASTLSAEQKEFKARYAAGRRDLEHEFEKTMRYKSVRGLLAKESGDVILDLKPIWLMSPLSVSDTLPLDVSRFDVVIFDEASQIPLEDAIPSVHRAGQIIVVGDEMQLPPTSFFSSRREEGEEGLRIEEDGEVVEYDLESDSFLNHSCRNLPATMLGWHYRSRSEALISFSNAAFYEGGLLTVPDRRASAGGGDDIVVTKASDGEANLERLLQKSLSFHYLERSPYDDRRNAGEAAYIASLVRETLRRKTGLSLGIIAFSEAQQDEIEGALASLAKEDAAFRELLDAEVDREEDGQFMGLLVKNLENIQGDERDLVILSICYGPAPDGRMLMNFGPINQSGGEKRLNVAFSRAKRHMAVVSSIRHDRITNEYNDGARCLKNYLRYSEAVSRGDAKAAQRLLDEEVGPRDRAVEAYRPEAAVDQLAATLRGRGYEVATGVGQSRFRCDLAVKKPGEPFYRAAVVVDTPRYFDQRDLLERELLKPRVLRAFDWRVFHLLAKDWYADRAGVLQRLTDVLEGKEEAVEPLPPLPPPPPLEKPIETAVFTAEPSPPSPKRMFECFEDGSSKFWEVSVAGNTMTVRFGRIGTDGQQRSKAFADEASARREADALVREKLGKGYREKKPAPL